MKKIALIAVFLLLAAYGHGQTGKTDQENIRIDTIKGSGNKLDTIITRKTEFSFNKTFPNNYKRDETVVQALRPYMVSEIVDPGNQSHPIYLGHLSEARQRLPEARLALLQCIKTGKMSREYMSKYNLANETDLNSITFLHIPVYYVTPNVALFQIGENVAKYYNLAIGGFTYLMFRNNRLVGYLNFFNGNSNIVWMPDFITGGYTQIKKLGKKPIVLNLEVHTTNPKSTKGHINLFGYMDHGHLIYSRYDEGIIKKVAMDAVAEPYAFFKKSYTLETAESFLFGNQSGPPTINRWLDNAVNRLKSIP